MIAIARLTLREALNKRILVVALLLTAAFLGLYAVGTYFAGRELALRAPRVIRMAAASNLLSAGLYLASFVMSFLAIFTAVGTISAEIDNGLLQVVVPRPVPRRAIVLGKFAGYAALIAVYAVLVFSAVLGIARAFLPAPVEAPLPALGLFVLQPIVLLALSLLGSALLSTLANGVAVVLLFGIGLIGGIIEQVGAVAQSETLTRIGIVSSLVMPADAIYRKMIHVLYGGAANSLSGMQAMGAVGAQLPPSAAMIVYATLYALAAVYFAVRAFEGRDL